MLLSRRKPPALSVHATVTRARTVGDLNRLSFKQTVERLLPAIQSGNWHEFSKLAATNLEIGQTTEIYLDHGSWSKRQIAALFPPMVFGGRFLYIAPPYTNTAGDLLSTCAVLVNTKLPPSAKTKALFSSFCATVRDSKLLDGWVEYGEDMPSMGGMPFTGPSVQGRNSIDLYWRAALADIHGRWRVTSLIISGYH